MAERDRHPWGPRVDAVRRLLRQLRAARGRVASAADGRAPREPGGGERGIRALLVELQRTARPLLAEAAGASPRRVRFEPDLPQPAMLQTHQGDDGRRRWSMSFGPAALSRRGPAKTRALADQLRRQLARERTAVSRDHAAAPPDLLALLDERWQWAPHLTRLDRWSEDFFIRMDRFLDTVLNLEFHERFEPRIVDTLPDLIFEEALGAVGGVGGPSFFAVPAASGAASPGSGFAGASAMSWGGERGAARGGVPVSASGMHSAPIHPRSPDTSSPRATGGVSRSSATSAGSAPARSLPFVPGRVAGLPPLASGASAVTSSSGATGSAGTSPRRRMISAATGGAPVVTPHLPGTGTSRGRRPRPSAGSLSSGAAPSTTTAPRAVPRHAARHQIPVAAAAPHDHVAAGRAKGRRPWVPLSLMHLPHAQHHAPAPLATQRRALPLVERHRPWSGIEAGAHWPRPLALVGSPHVARHGFGTHPFASVSHPSAGIAHPSAGIAHPLAGVAHPSAGIAPALTHPDMAVVQPHGTSAISPEAAHHHVPAVSPAVGVLPALFRPESLALDGRHHAPRLAALLDRPRRAVPATALRLPATAPGLLHATTPHGRAPFAGIIAPHVAGPSHRLLAHPALGVPRVPAAPVRVTAVAMPSPHVVDGPATVPLLDSVRKRVPETHVAPHVVGARAPFRPIIASQFATPTARSAAGMSHAPMLTTRRASADRTLDRIHDRHGATGNRLAWPGVASHPAVPVDPRVKRNIPLPGHVGAYPPSPMSRPGFPTSRSLGAHSDHAHAHVEEAHHPGHPLPAHLPPSGPHGHVGSLPHGVAAASPGHAALGPMAARPHIPITHERASAFSVPPTIPGGAVPRLAMVAPPSEYPEAGTPVPSMRRHRPSLTSWTASPPGHHAAIVPAVHAPAMGGLPARMARWATPSLTHAVAASPSALKVWPHPALSMFAEGPVAAGLGGGSGFSLAGGPAEAAEMHYVILTPPPVRASSPRHEHHVVIDSTPAAVHVEPFDDDRRTPARLFRAETGRQHRPEPPEAGGRPKAVGDDAREMRPQLPDLDRLAVNVYGRIKRQLAVERERRGFLK